MPGDGHVWLGAHTVVSGTAAGADSWGEAWACWYGVPVERFPAHWTTYGRSAGARRNRQMARGADALVAVWDGVSPGTRDMIDVATRAGLRVFVWQAQVASWSSPLDARRLAAYYRGS
jgi:glycerophosphoryl diester phosphodiesterase